MKPEKLAYLSCIAGVGSLAIFVVALLVQQLFPPAVGRHSALSSAAGPYLLILSTGSLITSLVALIQGSKAIRQLPIEALKRVKIAAWVGMICGGAYAAVAIVLPIFLIALWGLHSLWK
jgi:hypothetical protein